MEAKASNLSWEEAYEYKCKANDLERETLRGLRLALVSIYQAMKIEVDTFTPENYEL